MSKQKIIIGILLTLFLAVGYSNCAQVTNLGGWGTNTGNPDVTPPPSAGSPPVGPSQISQVLCAKLSQCFTPVLLSCENKLLASGNFTVALGLSLAQFPTLQAVQNAVTQGTLKQDFTKRQTCFDKIAALQCSSSLVVSSYDSSRLEDITLVNKLLLADSNCSMYLSP